MKNSVYIALATGLLLFTFMIAQGSSQNLKDTDASVKYATFIDETIQKCRNKVVLLHSSSPNIRRQAARASLKAAYLKIHKNELIAYLNTVSAEASRDRVEYHLNKHFYQSLRPDELYVLLEASEMLTRSE